MPKLKPLTASDFERVTKLLGQFVLRLGATVAAIERESRRRQSVNGAAAKGIRRRRHSPVDRAAVIKVVRAAGKKGFAAGRIAERLRVDVGRVRPVLWQLRDAGQLRMSGKLALARYHVPGGSATKSGNGTPRRGTKTASAKSSRAKAGTPKLIADRTRQRRTTAKPNRRSARAPGSTTR